MSVQIHELEVRIKYLRAALYKIMVHLLKFCVRNHKDCITRMNPDIGLAEIINTHLTRFQRKKVFHAEPEYKKCFYDTAGNLKTLIAIDGLELMVVYHLIHTSFISDINKRKCCGRCTHPCLTCPGVCQAKADCLFGSCSSCRNSNCESSSMQQFIHIVSSLRHGYSHAEFHFYRRFQSGRDVFTDFPRSKTFEDIWKIANESSTKCLDVMLKVGFLNQSQFDDLKMELRIALRKDIKFLLAVGESKRYHNFEIIAVLFALLAVIIWQIFVPGSYFSLFRCRHGHLHPIRTSNFTMNPLADQYANVFVEGLEFNFEDALKKTVHPNYKRLNEGYRYFVNIKRCAYGSIKEYVTLFGERIQRGPDMFAVDENCQKVFYYNDAKDSWTIYNSAKNLTCS
ncbi:uncharacterized protein [Clytia hemisphaerica]